MNPKWIFLDNPEETRYVLRRNSPSKGIVVVMVPPRRVRIKEFHRAILVACGVKNDLFSPLPSRAAVEAAVGARIEKFQITNLVLVNGQDLGTSEIPEIRTLARKLNVQLWITSEGSSPTLQDRLQRSGADRAKFEDLESVLPTDPDENMQVPWKSSLGIPRIPSEYILDARHKARQLLTHDQFTLFDMAYTSAYFEAISLVEMPNFQSQQIWDMLMAHIGRYDDPELAVAAILGFQASFWKRQFIIQIKHQAVRNYVLSGRHRNMTIEEYSCLLSAPNTQEAIILAAVGHGLRVDEAFSLKVSDLARPEIALKSKLDKDHPLYLLFALASREHELRGDSPNDHVLKHGRFSEAKVRKLAMQLNVPYPSKGSAMGSEKILGTPAAISPFDYSVLPIIRPKTKRRI